MGVGAILGLISHGCVFWNEQFKDRDPRTWKLRLRIFQDSALGTVRSRRGRCRGLSPYYFKMEYVARAAGHDLVYTFFNESAFTKADQGQSGSAIRYF